MAKKKEDKNLVMPIIVGVIAIVIVSFVFFFNNFVENTSQDNELIVKSNN